VNNDTKDFCISCGVHRNYGDTCDYCGRLYSDAPESEPRVNALASKYKISKNQYGSVITWKWGNRSAWIPLLFSFVWLAVSVPMFPEIINDPLAAIPAPMVLPIVGFSLAFYAIVRLINKTSIHVSDQSLFIKHHPIPWRSSFKISAANVEQVFVSRTQRSNEDRSWHAPTLQLVTINGQRHQLLKGNREEEFADYESLRHIILNALGIKPTPTDSESSQPSIT